MVTCDKKIRGEWLGALWGLGKGNNMTVVEYLSPKLQIIFSFTGCYGLFGPFAVTRKWCFKGQIIYDFCGGALGSEDV
jgi:hypothetical protein